MKKKNIGAVHTICVLTVICMFAVSAMMLSSVGAVVYKNIAERNLGSFQLRTSLSYIKTKINQFDETGRVSIEERNGVKALVLSEEVSGEIFDTVVYFNNGKLYEITGAKDMKFKPEDGFPILSVDSFEIENDNGLIRLITRNKDESETMYIRLRTA